MSDKYFDDLGLDEVFITEKRTIKEEDIMNFAQLTGDKNPLHLDEQYAKRTIFKGRIGHGELTAVIVTAQGVIPLGYSGIIALLKTETNFQNPVRINDEVYTEWKVVDKKEKGRTKGEIELYGEVKNQEGKMVAIVRRKLLMKKRKSKSEVEV